ncbi:MAG: trigger factor [Patescibacteria group bacterium]
MEGIVIKKLPKSQVLFEVTVPAEEVLAQKERAAEALSLHLEIDGFRKGKAPYEVVKQRVGGARVFEEAGYIVMEKRYKEIIDKGEFKIIGRPKVEIKKIAEGNPLVFNITMAVYPEVQLADYKAIADGCVKEKKAVEVDDKELNEAIFAICRSKSKESVVPRPAQKGDLAEVDFEIRLAGVKIEGGESRNHPIVLGEGKFIPGFEDGIIGMMAGEEKTFSITAPKDYAKENLRGKTLEVKIKANTIYEVIVPELTDEFAKSLGEFETAQALKDSVKKELLIEKENADKERVRHLLAQKVADKSTIDVADILVDQEISKMISELDANVCSHGADFEQYLATIKKTKDDLKNDFREQAERRVRMSLVLAEIADKENIKLDEAEISKRIDHALVSQQITDASHIDYDSLHSYISGIMRNEKVFDLLGL